MSSRSSPDSRRSRNSSVFARSCSSLSTLICSSSALTSSTTRCSFLSLRPSPARNNLDRTTSNLLHHLICAFSATSLGRVRQPGRWPSLQLQQLLSHGIDDRLHARVQMQLLQDITHVVLHRVFRNKEFAGNVAIVESSGHQGENLELPIGQPRRGNLRFVLLLRQVGELGQQR